MVLQESLLSNVSLCTDETGRAVATAVCRFLVRTTVGGVRPIDAAEGVHGLEGMLRARLSLVSGTPQARSLRFVPWTWLVVDPRIR